MRRILAGVGILVVVGLDLLALDDITTGHEPSFVVEWTFLFISFPALWGLFALTRRRRPSQRAA